MASDPDWQRIMDRAPQAPEGEIKSKLKWLILFRFLFSTLLLGSSIILHFGDDPAPLSLPLIILYVLIAAIFLLSIVYALGYTA
jgi:two-component system sensor histidine kinase PilS (NtrC family)